MPVRDATQRFSSRVEDYARYRPGYPPEVIQLLKTECGLAAESVVADIASGTGIFTRIVLEAGAHVFGVEPNAKMRRAAEKFLAGYASFTCLNGTAESTTLPDHSVDIITAAQAAHWFDPSKARQEFVRILKPGGWTVLPEARADVAGIAANFRLESGEWPDNLRVRHARVLRADELSLYWGPLATRGSRILRKMISQRGAPRCMHMR